MPCRPCRLILFGVLGFGKFEDDFDPLRARRLPFTNLFNVILPTALGSSSTSRNRRVPVFTAASGAQVGAHCFLARGCDRFGCGCFSVRHVEFGFQITLEFTILFGILSHAVLSNPIVPPVAIIRQYKRICRTQSTKKSKRAQGAVLVKGPNKCKSTSDRW